MTENSVIFNARHAAGSFHPHRQPAPTAQDCLKRGNGANWRTTRQLSGECRLNASIVHITSLIRSSKVATAIVIANTVYVIHLLVFAQKDVVNI